METQHNVQSKNSVPKDSVPEPIGKVSGSQAPTTEKSTENAGLSHSRSKKSVRWNPELVAESTFVASPQHSPRSFASFPLSSPSISVKDTVDTVRNVLERWGKKVGEATKKAEILAENTWQHLKTHPSFTEAAVGRIARGTKILAEGGYENIFHQTFDTVPGEQVLNAYACYVSTSIGPVVGILYISTVKIAYCSDNPLPSQDYGDTEWSYYKVIIPFGQLKAVIPSSNRFNPAEKYIQLICLDNQDFWFMGFFNYEGAVDFLKEVFQASKSQSER